MKKFVLDNNNNSKAKRSQNTGNSPFQASIADRASQRSIVESTNAYIRAA